MALENSMGFSPTVHKIFHVSMLRFSTYHLVSPKSIFDYQFKTHTNMTCTVCSTITLALLSFLPLISKAQNLHFVSFNMKKENQATGQVFTIDILGAETKEGRFYHTDKGDTIETTSISDLIVADSTMSGYKLIFGKLQNDLKHLRQLKHELKMGVLAAKGFKIKGARNQADRNAYKSQFKSMNDSISDYINFQRDLLYDYFIDRNLVWPCRNNEFTKNFYGDNADKSIQFLKNGYMNFASGARTFYTEFVSAYVPALGRLSFGGVYSLTDLEQVSSDSVKGQDSTHLAGYLNRVQSRNSDKTTVQNFIGGGGNAIINLSSPIYAAPRFFSDDVHFDLILINRLGMNLPAINSQQVRETHFFESGLEFYASADLSSSQSKITPFASGKLSGIASNDKHFYDAIGLSNKFAYTQLSIGIKLYQQFSFSYYWMHVIDKYQPFSGYFTVQFTPN
jgi:hypothetical protein